MPSYPGEENEPPDRQAHTEASQSIYTRTAALYDWAVRWVPLWRKWLGHALPHLQGPRVLEVSFGTGWLMTQYASRFEAYGIEYNRRMTQIAARNLRHAGTRAQLQVADVYHLPYASGTFDSVVNTMAFSGYAHGRPALAELARVLVPGGRIVMVDVGYPLNGSRLGSLLARYWEASGDILREMRPLFREFGFDVTEREIGGFGSVHLYVARKIT